MVLNKVRHYKTTKQTETACGLKYPPSVTPIKAEVTCVICRQRILEISELKQAMDEALEIVRDRIAKGTATPQEVKEMLSFGRDV